MSITVYSKPSCVQCNATYRSLDSKSINYDVVDLSEDPDALEYVKSLGYSSAPVVVTNTDSWSGYRPDKLSTITQDDITAAEQLVIDRIAARGHVTVDLETVKQYASDNTLLQSNLARLEGHLAAGRTARAEQTVDLVAQQIEIPHRIKVAGIERPESWEYWGSSARDTWEDRQIAALDRANPAPTPPAIPEHYSQPSQPVAATTVSAPAAPLLSSSN